MRDISGRGRSLSHGGGLDAVERLLANEQFAKSVKFISKTPPGCRLQIKESNARKQKRKRR
jgi:hypothetical protein